MRRLARIVAGRRSKWLVIAGRERDQEHHPHGGLTAADRALVAEDAQKVARAIPVTGKPTGPVVSKNGEVAL